MIFKFWEEQSPNNIIITQLKAAQLKKKKHLTTARPWCNDHFTSTCGV